MVSSGAFSAEMTPSSSSKTLKRLRVAKTSPSAMPSNTTASNTAFTKSWRSMRSILPFLGRHRGRKVSCQVLRT